MIISTMWFEIPAGTSCEDVAPVSFFLPPYTYDSFGAEFFSKLCALAKIHGVGTPSPVPFVDVQQPPYSAASFYFHSQDGRDCILAAIDRHPQDNLALKMSPFYFLLRRAVRACFLAPNRQAFLKSLCEAIFPTYTTTIELLQSHDYEGIKQILLLSGKNNHYELEILSVGNLSLPEGSYPDLFTRGRDKFTSSFPWREYMVFSSTSYVDATGEQFVLLFITDAANQKVSEVLQRVNLILTSNELHAGLIEKLAIVLLGDQFVLSSPGEELKPKYGETVLLEGFDFENIFALHARPAKYLPRLIEEIDEFHVLLSPKM